MLFFSRSLDIQRVIPPSGVGKGAHIEFEAPGGAMLMRDMKISVGDRGRFHDFIFSFRFGLSQLCNAFRSEQLAERVRRITALSIRIWATWIFFDANSAFNV